MFSYSINTLSKTLGVRPGIIFLSREVKRFFQSVLAKDLFYFTGKGKDSPASVKSMIRFITPVKMRFPGECDSMGLV